MSAPEPDFTGLLRDWLLTPEGQHEPPANGIKGKLQLWKEVESAFLPTIRADLIQAALGGKILIDGIELIQFLGMKLSDDAKVVLYSRSLGNSRI